MPDGKRTLINSEPGMQRQKGTLLSRIISFAALTLGVSIVAFSAFHPSSNSSILGVATISIGALFLYITPVEHVPLTLLNASAEATVDNIERLISKLDLTERGVYLPPPGTSGTMSSASYSFPKPPKPSHPHLKSQTKNCSQTKELARLLRRPERLSRAFLKGNGAFHS